MNKNDIREAYDRMNPPREAKERMMLNLLNQTSKKRSSNAEPVRYSRWSAVPAALALVCVLVLGWWIVLPGGETPVSKDPLESTGAPDVIQHDILDLEALFPDMREEYREVLGRYYVALSGEYDENQWESTGLNPAAYANLDVIEGLGYALMDLDGNGKEELLITDGDQVYDLYAEVDGEVRELLANRIHDQGKRISVKLCQENVFLIWQKSAGDEYVHWYRLGKDGLGTTALVCEEMVLLDNYEKWYAGPNDKDAVEVNDEEARQILNSREPVFIDFAPICPEKYRDTTDVIPSGYAEILSKYETAIEENWGAEQYMEHDMSYALVNMEAPDQYGYTLLDIDGNGVEELLITDGTYLYDVYTLLEDDRGPGHLISGGERLRYFLCGDGVIGYQGSGSAFNTIWQFSRLENGIDLIPFQTLMLGTDIWYTGVTEDDAEEITHEEAQEILDKYRAREISFSPLHRFELGQEGEYPSTYAQLLTDMVKLTPGMEDMYVSLVDVSGDGVSELLLGAENSFGHVYAIVNGKVEYILSYGSDEGFTLCEDGILMYHKPEDVYGQYTFISMKDNKPITIDELRYDSEQNSWFRYKTIGKEYLTEEEMQQVIASYNKLSLTMISVREYLDGESN